MMFVFCLAAGLLLECENFQKLGGWTIETQSMRQMGSSYVMAHGSRMEPTHSGRGRATGMPNGRKARPGVSR